MFVGGSSASIGIQPTSFDTARGISPGINSQNDLNCFLPSHHEQPRLAVLQNFKEINRMIRTNFMAGRDRRGLPEEELSRREREDEAARKLTNVMKQLYQA